MTQSATDKDRTAIPRWRPLTRVPKSDLASIAVESEGYPRPPKEWFEKVRQWRHESTLESYSELLDLGIVVGNGRWAAEGAAGVLSFEKEAQPRLIQAAKATLTSATQVNRSSTFFPAESNEPHAIFESIRLLKSKTIDYPRDGLLHCELSRLYSLIAQFDKAQSHIMQAVFLAPHNRYVLRSATKFFHFIDATEAILPHLRLAEGFQYDPWIQSAELAASQHAGKATRLPKILIRSLRGRGQFAREESELATGFAWAEWHSGAKPKTVTAILNAALHNPTENALAQALWVGEQSSASLTNVEEKAVSDPQAWEARSRALFVEDKFEESERQAALWFADQPLEARAALAVSYLNMIQLKQYSRAKMLSERASKLHPTDWSVRNCAMLAAAYAGDIERAREHLKAVSRLDDAKEVEIFAIAGEGFLSFFEGKIEKGRENYKAAIRMAKKQGRSNLILTAGVYWLERESAAGTMTDEEISKVVNIIDTSLEKLPPQQAKELKVTLDARRNVILKKHSASDLHKEKLIKADLFGRTLEEIV